MSEPTIATATVVRLIERQGRVLIVEGVDMCDGTPLLDIKPYVKRGGTGHAGPR